MMPTFRYVLTASTFAVSAALLAAPVAAQEIANPAESSDETESATVSEIIVTGSRISRRDYISDSPIVSIGQDSIAATGQVTPDKALAQMPQFAAAQGVQQVGDAQASTGFSGGQAYADLRGLGVNRALILLDGRRLQSSNPDGSIDLNTIPLALLQNVEVITGGASAVYGSDAIAGVVNFKFNNNFSGLQVGVQKGGSFRGDAGNSRFDVTVGGHFADDRGHAVLSMEYAQRDPVFGAARKFFEFGRPLAVLQTGAVVVGNNQPQISAVNAALAARGLGPLPGGPNYTGNIGVNPDQTIFTTGYGPSAPVGYSGPGLPLVRTQGANLQTLLFPSFLIQVPLDKQSVFSRVRYDLSDDLTVYGQGMFTHYLAKDTSSPSNAAGGAHQVSVPITNPFIPQALRNILASRPNPNANFLFWKQTSELGPRRQEFEYNVFQFLGGLRGNLPIKDWTFDAYGSYGRTSFINRMDGGGSDAAMRALVQGTANAPGCTGYGNYNPFGVNVISDACREFLGRSLTNSLTISQRDLEASIQGSLFDLPAGALKFSAGVDNRSTNFAYRPDSTLTTGDIFGFGIVNGTGGKQSVTEVYGELLVPLLEGKPFFEQLNLNLGYRYSDYDRAGGVSTYKATAEWQVVKGLRFRGGIERAIRAASVGELFAPRSEGNFQIGAPSSPTQHLLTGDPCDSNSAYFLGSNSAQVKALCLAQGVPASVLGTPFAEVSSTAPGQTGGNPNLTPETADTFSVGAILQPKFGGIFNNLNFAVDYYQIDIKNAVGTISISDVLSRCFNADGVSNPSYGIQNRYCDLITRNTSTGELTLIKGLLLNLAQYKTAGIDFQFDWRIDLADVGISNGASSISFSSTVSYVPTFKVASFAGSNFVNYAGTIGNASVSTQISHPKWKAVTNLGYNNGPVNFGITWRYIGAMKDQTAATNPTTAVPGVPAYSYFDLQTGFKINKKFEISGGIRNLFDKEPPVVGGVLGFTDASSYDIIGRSFYIGAKVKF